jgi:hypothetical protein
MATSKNFKNKIVKLFEEENKNSCIKDGYCLDDSTNLIEGVDSCLFFNDMMQGGGGELKRKFNAIYSSAALCVNNFAIVKQYIEQFTLKIHEKEISNFHCAKFERQFPTGLQGTPPTLDFVIENDDTVIAFESKYLEILEKKETKFSESYNQKKLDFIKDSPLFELIQKYKGKEMFLDVAQLIKHSIGLINYGINNKKAHLVYIYWKPQNSNDVKECYREHDGELSKFADGLKDEKRLHFSSMTYSEFWANYAGKDVFSTHFNKVKNRYDIIIKP